MKALLLNCPCPEFIGPAVELVVELFTVLPVVLDELFPVLPVVAVELPLRITPLSQSALNASATVDESLQLFLLPQVLIC